MPVGDPVPESSAGSGAGGSPVRYESVSKQYPGSDAFAVHDLSLEIPAGEICVLVGPSGCGKTTAMRMANRTVEMTTDALLGASDKYTILEDDKGVLPAGNVVFLTKGATIDKAGPDYAATIEKVQSGLTVEVMQELDARVDIDKQLPDEVASEYLKEAGYTD